MRIKPFPQDDRKIVEYNLEGTQTFESGSLVLLDASEEIVECGADPAAVLGVAVHQAANRAELFPTKMGVYLAEETRLFWMDGDNAPVAGDVNQSYGVAKDADGIWHVDGTDTTNLVVYVVRIDTDRNLYLVRFLAAVRQSAP